MKDKVLGLHIDLSQYSSPSILSTGIIYFFRGDKKDTNKIRISSCRSIPYRRVARALEAQRLFLSQLEKATK